MNKTASKALAATGIIAGLGVYFGSIVTSIVLTGNESKIDSMIHEDVVQIVDKVDRVLLAEGTSSFNKEITDLNLSYDLQSSETSLQMAGTFKNGYCIRVTDPGGAKAEKGKTYSVSAEGELNAGTPRCNTIMDAAPVIAGPAIDENSKTAWEMADTSYWTLIGTSGLGVLFIAGTFVTAGIQSKQQRTTTANEIVSGTSSIAISPITPEENPAVEAVKSEAMNTSGILSNLNIRIAEIKKQWAEYELDLVKILAYPTVTNMSLPATSDFHKAMRQVKVLMPEGIPAFTASLSVLSDAVLDLEHKFDVMISEAKRSKWSSFSDDERISLKTAQNLLSIAINEASTPNERQIAYKRLMKEVEGIIVLPEKSIAELEAKISLAIDSVIIRESVVV